MKNILKINFAASLVMFFSAIRIFAAPSTDILNVKLPALNPQISPLAEGNRSLLLKRIVAAFDYKYNKHLAITQHQNLADGIAVYYLRQELQALIDMWRATGKEYYLAQARKRTLKAINDAKANPHVMLHWGKPRGRWPCFFSKQLLKAAGGHGQLWDFQGSAGFMMVANALHQANKDGWKEIADFVEKNIVEKWLFYLPSIKPENLISQESNKYLLEIVRAGRDKREHFACICMDLGKLGYNKYPYKQWAKFLTKLYVGKRTDIGKYFALSNVKGAAPEEWGVIPNNSTNGYVWYYSYKGIFLLDTSHANRTAWLAAKAYSNGFIDEKTFAGFVNTLENQIWDITKGPFYFNNFIDGSDKEVKNLSPGEGGSVWFGWHRLAAYNQDLKSLFISMAYDLTNGGPNFPELTLNKTKPRAPLCLLAWGARLLSDDGKPEKFP